jgi:glycosyltransferase involved in cell wall biosynthesis
MEVKRPEYAIYALSRFLEDGVHATLTVAGSGELEGKLRRLAEKEGLKDKVSFLGAVDYKKISDLMLSSDVFVFPSSHWEGWGAVLNEAMSAGCSCLCSSLAGSTAFLIKDRANGLVFENRKGLYQAVDAIAKDPSIIKETGEAARAAISEVWNARVAVKNLMHFVETGESEKKREPGCLIAD